ncbi:Cytochrome p450 [Thalictrum thalictroides]|uniref:Cytochrome p450 n=1 Tax=Thalictrum thalictroides TaxID=46969 RepID=A0A7J6WEU0_THATH|nr:Cytochrome p450 [Thalictrum thalictroides]
MESWVLFAFLAGLYSLFYLFSTSRYKNNGLQLPPGPFGLPLLGHLHLLGELPHHNLQRLAKKYGPIMTIRLGVIPTMVISSPEWAELFLKTHDIIFASRPKLQVSDLISYGQKNLIFAQYGSYWRNIRKLCTLELLSNSKIELFKSMRSEELFNFVQQIKNASKSRSVIDISAKVESLLEDMTFRMIFGCKDDRIDFKTCIKEVVILTGAFNVSDYLPILKPFDLQGLGRRMKACSKVLDEFLETIIDEHVRDAKDLHGQHRDFIDVMLSLMESNNTRELHLDRDNIKAIMIDMLGAAMETSSTTSEWVIAELLKHPKVMKLVQEELENIVGLDRMVEEADLIKLSYLKVVIMETLRIHPVAPLLIPHESTEDITINGYFIPKKSRVIINSWAIGRDPTVWSSNAEEFYPERFIGTDMDVQGRDFQYIPFGSGRRKCPGLQLGMTAVQLVVAQLVHCFNLELPEGMSPDDLDMNEKFGLTVPRANHLMAVPTYRLRMNF